MGGEALFKEILMAAAYSLIPYILLAIPLAGLSRFLSAVAAERNVFLFLNNAVLFWVVALLFVSVKSMHDYHVGKALVVCAVSLFGMLLIWAIFVLMFALTGNLKAFIQGLALEIWMTIRYR
jgi:hypothetical protein